MKFSTLRFEGLLISILVGIVSNAPFVAMAQSASISNVSQDIFSCMRKHTRTMAGWITYEGSDSGRIRVYATGAGQVGEVTYSFNSAQKILSLAYVQGPAPFSQIQSGMNDTANKCKSGEYS